MAVKFNQSPLAKCAVTPPHLNRQHSYGIRQEGGRALTCDASSVLASVASRTTSPGRRPCNNSSTPSPTDGENLPRRTSWDDCNVKRDGYVSFPDFDQLRAQRDDKTP